MNTDTTDSSHPVTSSEAQASKPSEHPEPSTSSSPMDAFISLFSDKLLRSARIHMTDVTQDVYFPDAPPYLGFDATRTGDTAQPFRRISRGVTPSGTRSVIKEHPVPIDVPGVSEPIASAQEVVSGLALPSTAVRSNGPNDYTGIARPIIACMSKDLSASWTWDFTWLYSRTLCNLHTIQGAGDPINSVPGWTAGGVAAPAAPDAYDYMTLPFNAFGSYISNTLATANGDIFKVTTKIPIIFLPRWDINLAQVAYSAWTSHEYLLRRLNAGTYYKSILYHYTTTPRPTRVLFVCPEAVAATDFSTGNFATNATNLPITAPLYEEYLEYLQNVIGDPHQVFLAGVNSCSNPDIVYSSSAGGGQAFEVVYPTQWNSPNPYAFALLNGQCVLRTRERVSITICSRWILPLADIWWSAIEFVALMNRTSVWSVTHNPANLANRGTMATRSWKSLNALSRIYGSLGIPFSPFEVPQSNVGQQWIFPVLTPNKWLEEYGLDVVTAAPSIRWEFPKAATNNQRYHLVCRHSDNHFSLDLERGILWISAAQVGGAGAEIAPILITGNGAGIRLYSAVLDNNGVISANAADMSQLRPFMPTLTDITQEPSDSTDNTWYYTGTDANVTLLAATGSAHMGFRLDGSDFALNLLSDRFLGVSTYF